MLRLIGILIGSALAIGFLIVVLGVPQFAGPDETDPVGGGLPATEPVVDDLPATDPEPVGGGLPATDPEPVGGGLPATDPEPVGGGLPATDAEPVGGGLPATDAETLVLIDQIFEPATEFPGEQPAVDENWYAFWSPFRSEIAANGFVSRLQETTGIDYRVVKVKTGVYEVAFAYSDDADIQDKLARISSATGLDMSGS